MALTPLTVQLQKKEFDPNWRKSAAWLSIKKITLADCLNKTGEIIAGEPLNKKVSQEKVFTFGKYSGRTYKWVEQNDSNYYNWAKENIKGFSP